MRVVQRKTWRQSPGIVEEWGAKEEASNPSRPIQCILDLKSTIKNRQAAYSRTWNMAHILGMVSEVWRSLWSVPGWSRSRWQYCDPDCTPWPLLCRQSMRVKQAALRGSPVLASYHPLHCHPLGHGCHFESVCWLTLQHFTPADAGWRRTLWLASFHNT